MNAGPGKLDARAKELFAAALERPEGERAAFLEQACSGNSALRRQVETLLRNLGDAQERFEEPPPAPGEQPGDTIGHYKLRQKIGEGGFGVVWMAEQEQPVRRMVALKVLKPGMDTAQVIGRFEAERQALALMDHPNIAKVFDGGATPSGRPYFVMELVKGVPITKYCDDAGLSMEERLELFVPVCQAVQHAHQKGVIHRDIKPSNVLVTLHDGTPTPKVIDFGIAKAARGALTQRTVFTEFRQMIGTPEYMAPEQAALSALDVDTRADVYSLGVVLYELLTGTRPFELRTLLEAGYEELLRTIREVDPPKPSTRVSTLGDQVSEIARHRRTAARSLGSLLRGDLDWIVMKALEKERSRRYETASALAEDVQRHLRNEPVLASPPSRVYRLRKYVRRHRIGAIATCAVAVSLVVGAVAAGLGYVEARDQAELARLAEKRADAERAAAVESAAEAQRQKEAAQAAEHGAREQAERAEMVSTLACTEANRAESVVMLLTTMLASGDPHVTRDKDYPVRSVLEDFERSLGDTLKEQPEVEAMLRRVLGRAYLGLGLPERAEPHLLRATELRRATFGMRHPLVAQSLDDESSLRHAQGRYDEAVRLAHAGQDAIPKEPSAEGGSGPEAGKDWGLRFGGRLDAGAERELRISLLSGLSDNLRHLGDMDGAETAARAAVSEAEQHAGPGSALAVGSGAVLALALMDLGRPAEAEPFLRADLDHSRRTNDGQLSASLNNLAACLGLQGRDDEALPLFVEAVQHEEQLLGKDSPELATFLYGLGLSNVRLGHVQEGDAQLRRALTLTRQHMSANDSQLDGMTNTVVDTLLRNGEPTLAEEIQREHLRGLENLLGEAHPEVVAERQLLVLCVALRGDWQQVEQLLRRTQQLSDLSGSRPEELADLWSRLGTRLKDRGALDEAARCRAEAARLLQGAAPGSSGAARALSESAVAHLFRGEVDLAIQEQRAALELIDRVEGELATKAAYRQRLAACLQDAGLPTEAEPYAREAVDRLRSLLPARDGEVVAAESTLARILDELGRFEEAEALLRGILDCARGADRHGHLAILADVFLRQGRGAEAEPFARECLALRQRAMLGSWAQYSAMSLLGEALLVQGRLDEAEPLLREAAERMPDAQQARRRALPDAYRRLIRLYEAQGRDAEARPWREKLEALQPR